MRRLLLLIFILCLRISCWGSGPDSLLTELDRVLKSRDIFERAQKESIEEHRANLESSVSLQDQYNSLRGLYTAYRSYKIDSAMIIADERLRVAREIGDRNKIASATLNLAESYVKSGSPEKAVEILDTIDENFLENYHIKYRLGIYRNAYTAIEASSLLPSDRMQARDKLHYYIAEAMKHSPVGSLGYYTLKAERLRDAGMYREAVAVIEEAEKSYDLSEDAAMQFTLGEMYLAAGRRDKAVDCLARSSIIDVTNGVKEYRALILLASILFEDGDVERAFEYINSAFDDAEFSHSGLRTAEIMKIMPVIDTSFHALQRQMAKRTKTILVVAGVLILLLIVSLSGVVYEYLSNKRILSVNAEIKRTLEIKNKELKDADSLKKRQINMLMQTCATYVSGLRDFRKTVYRLLQTSQAHSAMELVSPAKGENADIATLHEMFDDAFLSMYPGFVEETGRFMKSPIKVKPAGLSPELRVAAMIRLGMSSTEEIATLMHYTTQTVYNLRSSLKGMLKVSWEEFETYLKEG